MLRLACIIVTAVLLAPPCGSVLAQQKEPSSPEELISRFESTGGARDAAGRTALFTHDAVVINAFGNRVEGAEAVAAFWKELYASGTFDQSKSERISLRRRELAPGLLLVDYAERMTAQRGPNSGRKLPLRTIHITLILRRASGGWRIAYYQAGDVRELPRRGRRPSLPRRGLTTACTRPDSARVSSVNLECYQVECASLMPGLMPSSPLVCR